MSELRRLIGTTGAEAVQALLEHSRSPAKGLLASTVGGLTLLLGATSVFAELQSDLDRVWRVPPASPAGMWFLIRARVLSFGLVLALSFLLLVSLLMSAALAALGKWWGTRLGGWELVLQYRIWSSAS